MESLAVKAFLEKAPRPRAPGISDAGWRGFLHMLKYSTVKCEGMD
jgi:hypothetical protein